MNLDLGSLRSVRIAAASISKKYQHIDLLINCGNYFMFSDKDRSEETLRYLNLNCLIFLKLTVFMLITSIVKSCIPTEPIFVSESAICLITGK